MHWNIHRILVLHSKVTKKTTVLQRQLTEDDILHCFDQWKTRIQQCVAAEEEYDIEE